MAKKIQRPAIQSREQAEACLREYSQAELELNALSVELDSKITAIRQEYEAAIVTVSARRDHYFDILQAYADSHPELFTNKKSCEMLHGILRYRTGNPAVKQRRRGKTWEAILETIRNLGLDRFIRTKEEVNKEEILIAHGNKEISEETMEQIGIKVDQDESFSIEPKLESLDARKQAA